ncbi:hypothetical protein D3C80_1097160 [compost metagenome]
MIFPNGGLAKITSYLSLLIRLILSPKFKIKLSSPFKIKLTNDIILAKDEISEPISWYFLSGILLLIYLLASNKKPEDPQLGS